MSVIKMTDLDLAGKRVLIRQDLNVPVKDGKVTSDKRIRASLPSIEKLVEAGAKVMIMSHLGRPTEGSPEDQFSLLSLAILARHLHTQMRKLFLLTSVVLASLQSLMQVLVSLLMRLSLKLFHGMTTSTVTHVTCFV